MSVEFIGAVQPRLESEIHLQSGNGIDKDYVEKLAKVLDDGGFDRALVAFNSRTPDSLIVGTHIAAVTKNLGLMLAHRPGLTEPTLAARQLASLDVLSQGRVAVHIIAGGNDDEMKQDGIWINKEQRYTRAAEYIEVLKKEWTTTQPFDHEGNFYRYKQAFSHIKPEQHPHIPIYFGGASDDAIRVAGQYADVYALWGESVDQVKEIVARVKAEAAKHNRHHIRFSLSLRPIIADTEAQAWELSQYYLQRAKEIAPEANWATRINPSTTAGSIRQLETASKGKVVDKRLWTELAQFKQGKGSSTALVGTAEQVADSLLDYYNAGIDAFLIRGFDPLNDAEIYGRQLLPVARQLVSQKSNR